MLVASARASASSNLPPTTIDRNQNLSVRFVLVRHGQSTWNAEGRIQGSSDVSVLTEKGKRQAREAAELVRRRVFFSSRSSRTGLADLFRP